MMEKRNVATERRECSPGEDGMVDDAVRLFGGAKEASAPAGKPGRCREDEESDEDTGTGDRRKQGE